MGSSSEITVNQLVLRSPLQPQPAADASSSSPIIQQSLPRNVEESDSNDNGDHNVCKRQLKVSTKEMKVRKREGRKKVAEPKIYVIIKSDVDVLEDGYKWRKYGQKVAKNSLHPRNYYRCTQENCKVKKRVTRLDKDPRMVLTLYQGRHIHSIPLQETMGQPPSDHLNNFFC